MGKKWLVPLGLIIFFSVAVLVLFLENKKTPAAGFLANDSAKQAETGAAASPREIIKQLNQPGIQLTKAHVDLLLLRLLQLQSNAMKQYESVLFSNAMNVRINQYRLEDLAAFRIKDPEIKSLVHRIYNDGFKLSSSEGMLYIECDYPKLLNEYGRHSSSSMTRYLKIMAEETNRHFAEDAALTIPPHTLAQRLLRLESFLHDYPDFEQVKSLRILGQRYLSAYLIGLNNTPAFGYRTNRLENNFLSSYRQIVKRSPSTKFTDMISDYLQVLEQKRYLKTPDVLNFVGRATRKTL